MSERAIEGAIQQAAKDCAAACYDMAYAAACYDMAYGGGYSAPRMEAACLPHIRHAFDSISQPANAEAEGIAALKEQNNHLTREKQRLASQLAQLRTENERLRDIIEATKSFAEKNTMLRKIASRIPAKQWMKAQEDAGFGNVIKAQIGDVKVDEHWLEFVSVTHTRSMTMSDKPKCELCGEPMPPGEEMFNFHGYSGPCPKPALPEPPTVWRVSDGLWVSNGECVFLCRSTQDSEWLMNTLNRTEK